MDTIPETVQEQLKGEHPPFLLDVRQPGEFSSGHIKGAKLIPLGELNARMDELPKDQLIVCVCASGSRSGMATRQLNAQGFNVQNMRGGMMGWAQRGFPIARK